MLSLQQPVPRTTIGYAIDLHLFTTAPDSACINVIDLPVSLDATAYQFSDGTGSWSSGGILIFNFRVNERLDTFEDKLAFGVITTQLHSTIVQVTSDNSEDNIEVQIRVSLWSVEMILSSVVILGLFRSGRNYDSVRLVG